MMLASPVPTTVITGFLGSGKTTLLNALLRHPQMAHTAVLVNEFGEIGIDHFLIETLDEDVVLLNAGCLCCTIRNDLVGALASLSERRAAGTIPDFRRVAIETTGLADPAPILHTLLDHESVRDRYCVDGIVTTVDAVNGALQLTQQVECVKQIAVADRVVLTKTDIGEPSATDALRARIAGINPGASIIEAVHGAVEPSRLLDAGPFDRSARSPDVESWLNEAAHEHAHDAERAHDPNRHDDRIRSFCLSADEPLEMHRFVEWIETLIAAHGDRLLRLKGVLNVLGSDAPVVVHGVQHVFHPLVQMPAWPDADRRSRIVIIARDLERETADESFQRLVLS